MTLIPAVVVMMMVTVAGQSPSARMTGSWTAELDGRTYVRLDLRSAGGTLGGGISLGSVEVDKAGVPIRVGEAPRELTPIFDVTATETTLRFARKDGNDTDRFELRLTDAGRAELQPLLTDRQLRRLSAEGIPAPKPFALARQ
jgi:hypothetical protein